MELKGVLSTIPIHLEVADIGVGRFHSAVLARDRTLYLSDEFNHRVICCDSEGRRVWVCGRDQRDGVHFRYPRGLALGSVKLGGEESPCLAVCDAWNHRLVFLSLQGRYLTSWTAVNSGTFAEVSDVRFLGGMQPYWLVLDTGNHRVIALDTSGTPLFHVGCKANDVLASRWAQLHTGIPPDLPEGHFPYFRPFDPLYYPSSLLGNSEDALYIWEPLRSHVKQIFLGNLFPIAIPEDPRLIWIGADPSTLMAWDRARSRILRFDSEGRLLQELEIEGIPVLNHTAPASLFIQDREWTQQIILHPKDREQGGGFPFLEVTARRTLASHDQSEVTIEHYRGMVRALLDLVDQFLKANSGAAWRDAAIKDWEARAAGLWPSYEVAKNAYEKIRADVSLALTQSRLLPQTPADLQRMGRSWIDRLNPIRDPFSAIVRRRERLFLARSANSDSTSLCLLIQSWESELSRLVGSYMDFCPTPPRPRLSFRLPWQSRRDKPSPESFPSSILRPPASSRCAWPNSSLEEVATLSFESSSSPYGLSPERSGSFYVALSGRSEIVRVDGEANVTPICGGPESRFVRLSRPLGVAVDSQDRLWITDSGNNRIVIFNQSDGSSKFIDHVQGSVRTFYAPIGICYMPGDFVLIADTGNNRIVRASMDGACTVLCDLVGEFPGELCQPGSLRADPYPGSGTFWVSEYRNHRLQQFSQEGAPVRQFGICGMDRDELYWPESFTFLPHGFLAIALGRPNPRIKVFSQTGRCTEELLLDYAPGCISSVDERILVPEFDGRSLRIYRHEIPGQ